MILFYIYKINVENYNIKNNIFINNNNRKLEYNQKYLIY